MYPTLTSSASSSIRSFLMKRTSFERSANRLRGSPLLLVLIIPYAEILVNKKLQRRRFRRRFFLPFCSAPDRRAGDSLFISFPGSFTVAAVLPPISSNTEKAARGFPFSFKPYPESPLAGLPAFYPSAFPSFCAIWAPASGALALYYILQTYIIMYV